MYWPIATPRIYATSSSRNPAFKLFDSSDGLLPSPSEEESLESPALNGDSLQPPQAEHGASQVVPPPTPITPQTPGIQPFEFDAEETTSTPSGEAFQTNRVPSRDPILALRVSRTGHLFAVITKTTITVWQTKVSPLT